MVKKHRKYMEDDFDLDLFIKDQSAKAFQLKLNSHSKKLLGIVKILIIIAAFITAFELYSYASHLIEVWRDSRINETARDIVEQAAYFDESAVTEELSAPVAETRGVFSAPSAAAPEVKAAAAPVLSPAILKLRDEFNNSDIAAYLKIGGTNIDFPIVQTGDNAYYLTHDLRRQDNAAGSAFIDFENQQYPLDRSTVIYAHNMRDGSMFHNIRNYNDPGYFSAHKIISLQTLYEDTLWEIFSFYETNTEFLYNTTAFSNADEFVAFANILKEKSIYPSDVNFTADSKILTLSTCTNRGADLRYVIHARRVK